MTATSSLPITPTNLRADPGLRVLATFPSLKGRSVLVTGGGTGIGAAMVQAFAAQGARVAFVDMAREESENLCEQIARDGHTRPWWKPCDVRDLRALQATIDEASKAVGDFSVLVNNVARDDRHTLEDVTPEYFEERMAVNLRPAFFAIQSVVPGMKRVGFGSIINLGSTGWQEKDAAYPCYAIAKSAVNGLTRGLARSLGAHRIRVNTVSPGWVMTERQLKLWFKADSDAVIAAKQCLPDKLMPFDIARMVLFLASDDSTMCTAQEFKVDAGWS